MITNRGKIHDKIEEKLWDFESEFEIGIRTGHNDFLKSMLNIVIDALDEYNEFLLSENYTDCDVLCEEPTALDKYLMKLNKD